MNINLKSGLLKNTAIYALSDGINKAIPFLILPVIVRYLTPEDYGIITNYAIAVQILSVFVYSAAQGSVPVNFFKMNKNDFKDYLVTIFSLSIIVSLVVFILFLILHNQICDLLNLDAKYLFLSIIEVVFGAFTCVNMLLWRCEEEPTKFGVYQLCQTILSVVLTLWFVVSLEWAWEGKILATLITTSLMGLFSMVILYRRGYFDFRLGLRYRSMVLSFALPLIPHALALWGKTGIDKILITDLEGLSENGIYSTAITWGAIITIFLNAFGNAFNPYLLKKIATYDKSDDYEFVISGKRQLVKLSYAFIVGLFILVFCAYFVFYWLIIFIYPETYHGATKFLSWIMLGEFFRGAYLIFINYIHYTLNTKVLGLITFSLSCLQVLVSYLLIKQYGTIGAALSTCLISLLTAVFVGIYSNKVYPMPWFNFSSRK